MKNEIRLIGRIGQDPKTVKFNNGQVTNATIATTEKYKKSDGEKVEETQWHKLVFKNKLSENADLIVQKGDLLDIDGKVKYRTYTNRDGDEVATTEIIVLRFLKLSGSKKNTKNTANHDDVKPVNQTTIEEQEPDLPF